MPKYEQPEEGEWVQPIEHGYKMACCSCGLVHRVDFQVVDGRAQFRIFDAPRSTGQIRRYRHLLTPTEHAERVVRNYQCLRELPPKVIESIKARIAFEIKAYAVQRGRDE